jgi:hypothetical protein
MIISASRRTDIPAFYPRWLLNRLQAGQALVPNPRRRSYLTQVCLSPETVDCLVLWTKNPGPLLEMLPKIDRLGFQYYFEFTVTAYGPELEPGLPPKEEIFSTFRKLAAMIGPARVDLRYDPIIITEEMTADWHLDQLDRMLKVLAGSADRIIVSFVDCYRHLKGLAEVLPEDIVRLAEGLGRLSQSYGLPVLTCAEKMDLSRFGINQAACIDRPKIERLIGRPLKVRKDPGQRSFCGCAESLDLGIYNTCLNGCVYCYATSDAALARRQHQNHDPLSPLLIGRPRGDESLILKNYPPVSLSPGFSEEL